MMALTLIQGAFGIQITASGGSNGESSSVSINYDALKDSTVNSEIAINGADLSPSIATSGSIAKFEQTHSVKDASGKSASVYVKVLNAPNGVTYASRVLPKEGSVATQTQVSAEQWLTVPKADSIKCTATASYGTIRFASVGIEEARSTATGDYVTLTRYYGKAVTTGSSVLASQTATSGTANSIKIYGTAKDNSGTYKVDTPVKGISGGKATFTGLSETASAGTTTQVTQKEHLKGTFTGKATAATKTITRSSNYGTEYDLNLAAKKSASGPTISGIMGYYIRPTLRIQGAVNAALSGDTINVAAGTYKEKVIIDKSLTISGAGGSNTIVNGNKLGTVFTIGSTNTNIDVTLSGLGITGGSGVMGGGIYNHGRATIKNCLIFANSANYGGGGIFNAGTVTVSGSTISGNSATFGGGINNVGAGVKLTVIDSTISGNSADHNGGGIWNAGTITVSGSTISKNSAKWDGGGIYNGGSIFVRGASQITNNQAITGNGGGIFSANNVVAFDGTKIAVKSNKAHLPSSQTHWYSGWGVYLATGAPILKNGFDPTQQVTGNTHI